MSVSSNNPIRPGRVFIAISVIIILLVSGILVLTTHPEILRIGNTRDVDSSHVFWQAPDSLTIPNDESGRQIQYGKELIAHTARYLGPKGSVLQISNGMNCQNCHLKAGTQPFGNNYGSVASMYPKFRPRSGTLESIEKRINDCLERSLNGVALDSLSTEMRAMVAYMKWVGKDVPKGKRANGSGLVDIAYLDRAADTLKGRYLFAAKCVVCHGKEGQGIKRVDDIEYVYPPLWGEHSFNVSAGLYRISNIAKYIFANMPQGATHDKPLLTEEEAWDIAAFVVSRPHPKKIFKNDWPKLSTKPVDYPFGPYVDSFGETQHKFGPFKPILKSLN